jgi:hypothetical protein
LDSGFESLADLKPAKLKITHKIKESESKYIVDIQLKNVSSSIAFFNQLQLQNKKGSPIRPSFYTDNFFSLLPGESKSVSIETELKNLDNNEKPVLVVKGWNIEEDRF